MVLSALLAVAARQQSAATAFVNVSVIPMETEQVLSGQTVLVRGTTITAVGPTAQVRVPAGATQIDGQGKFLIPALGDMHAHMFSPEDNGKLDDWYASSRLFCYIAAGVTTVRFMADDTSFSTVRDMVTSGRIRGPRIEMAGVGRDTVPQYLQAIKARGYRFVRVPWNAFTAEDFDSLAMVTAKAGMRLVGDVPVTLERALKAPYGSIEQLQGYLEHLAGREPNSFAPRQAAWNTMFTMAANDSVRIDESKIPEIAAATQRAGVWNAPLQAQAEQMVELLVARGASATSPVIHARRTLIKALQDAGAGLLLGTDAPTWGVDYGFGAHQELETLVASGLTPYQALATGTKNVATFLGTIDSAGTIATGKRADLILVNGNPLQDIRHTAKIAGVMYGGRWMTRVALDAQVKPNDCNGR